MDINNFDANVAESITNERKILVQKMMLQADEIRQRIRDHWNNLEPFNGDPEKVPDLPMWDDYKGFCVPKLIECGAIPKKDLVVGAKYLGTCRNADTAVWNGTVFEYQRYKFGMYFDDKINHFEDDNGYDLFVPVKRID